MGPQVGPTHGGWGSERDRDAPRDGQVSRAGFDGERLQNSRSGSVCLVCFFLLGPIFRIWMICGCWRLVAGWPLAVAGGFGWSGDGY
jgi:hypothetical protein